MATEPEWVIIDDPIGAPMSEAGRERLRSWWAGLVASGRVRVHTSGNVTIAVMADEPETTTYDPHEGHPVVSPEIAVNQDEVSTGPQPEPDPDNPAKDGPPKE